MSLSGAECGKYPLSGGAAVGGFAWCGKRRRIAVEVNGVLHLIYALGGAAAAAVLAGACWYLRRRRDYAAALDLSSGLFTLPSFLAMGERLLALAARRRSTCSLLLLRAVGEPRSAALHIVKTIRASDLVGRVGREEIALLLPETGREGTKVLLERLGKTGQVEFLGLSHFPEYGSRCEALLQAARSGVVPIEATVSPEQP